MNKAFHKETRKAMFNLVLEELKEDPFYKFKIVFALMSVIPLLTFVYIVLASGIDINRIGSILYILIAISILGFISGFNIIRKLLDRIVSYTAEIKRSEQIKAELAASVSHDFKTPIIILKELIRTLSDGSLGHVNDAQKSRLASFDSTLSNMTHTIETLLDLYKIEAGMVELKKSPCDIVKLINAKMDEFKVLLDKNGIRIERGIPFKGLQVNIDEGKIKEAIGNILSNAIKFTPENGQVKVGISVDKSFIRIEFSNNSENIPSEKLSVIFEKFKRLDEATEGTGLGLAIAKDIVELHGGDIWAENLHGKGVKFIVVLPLS